MASPTEQDIQNKRETVEKLRGQVAEADARRAANVAERTREIEAARLDAEQATLEARLERSRASATKKNIREGTERVSEQVSATAERAEAQQSAANDTKER